MEMTMHLRLNPILCDGYGQCAELLPEVVELDEWGYPIIPDEPLARGLQTNAQRAVKMCPRLALSLEEAA